MHAYVVDKMDYVTPSVRKQFSLSLSLLQVAPRKLIFKLYNNYDIECTCAGVEAQQLSISSVSLHHILFYLGCSIVPVMRDGRSPWQVEFWYSVVTPNAYKKYPPSEIFPYSPSQNT